MPIERVYELGSTVAETEQAVELCKAFRAGADRAATADDCAPSLYADEAPPRKVELSPFALDPREVTIAEFRTYLEAHGSPPTRAEQLGRSFLPGEPIPERTIVALARLEGRARRRARGARDASGSCGLLPVDRKAAADGRRVGGSRARLGAPGVSLGRWMGRHARALGERRGAKALASRTVCGGARRLLRPVRQRLGMDRDSTSSPIVQARSAIPAATAGVVLIVPCFRTKL
jgi:hypothetical protein